MSEIEDAIAQVERALDRLKEVARGSVKPVERNVHHTLTADNFENFPQTNFPTPEQPHSRYRATIGGRDCVAFEIKKGDPQWSVDAKTGQPKRRAEFQWNADGWRFPYQQDCWAGGLFYLPSDPMASARGVSIFQLHNYPESQVMAKLLVWDGTIKATTIIDRSDKKNGSPEWFVGKVSDYADRWVPFAFNFRASTSGDGYVRLYLDGDLVGRLDGPNKPDGKMGPYFKNGLYFWGYDRWGESDGRAKVCFDQLRIGKPGATMMDVVV